VTLKDLLLVLQVGGRTLYIRRTIIFLLSLPSYSPFFSLSWFSSGDLSDVEGASPRRGTLRKTKISPLGALGKKPNSYSPTNSSSALGSAASTSSSGGTPSTSSSSSSSSSRRAKKMQRHEDQAQTVHNPIFRKFIPKNASSYVAAKSVVISPTSVSSSSSPTSSGVLLGSSPSGASESRGKLFQIPPLRFALKGGQRGDSKSSDADPVKTVTNPLFLMARAASASAASPSSSSPFSSFPSSSSSPNLNSSPRSYLPAIHISSSPIGGSCFKLFPSFSPLPYPLSILT
jgi:hypothetical protein